MNYMLLSHDFLDVTSHTQIMYTKLGVVKFCSFKWYKLPFILFMYSPVILVLSQPEFNAVSS